MVTREALCLARDEFTDEVGKKDIFITTSGRVVKGSRGSKGEFPEFRILLEILRPSLELFLIQECIPVGCVLPAH